MNTELKAEQQMKATILNCPGFETMPKGVEPMLLASEAHRFDQAASHPRSKPLTFGDFVAGVYHTWGKRKAKGIIQLAIKAHVIEFRGQERFVVS